MRVLFLDDDRERHRIFRQNAIGHDLVQAWSYEDALAALAGERFDQVFLDHDLSDQAAMGTPGPGEKTGLDAAVLLAALPDDRRPQLVVIHSYNPAGAQRMAFVLGEAGYRRVHREPFSANRTAPRSW